MAPANPIAGARRTPLLQVRNYATDRLRNSRWPAGAAGERGVERVPKIVRRRLRPGAADIDISVVDAPAIDQSTRRPFMDENRGFRRTSCPSHLHQLVPRIADGGRVLVESRQVLPNRRSGLRRIDEHQPEANTLRFIRSPKALHGWQKAIGNRAIGPSEDEHRRPRATRDVQRIRGSAAQIDSATTLREEGSGSRKNRKRERTEQRAKHSRPQGAAHNEEYSWRPRR
jgi:hypothetical protein